LLQALTDFMIFYKALADMFYKRPCDETWWSHDQMSLCILLKPLV